MENKDTSILINHGSSVRGFLIDIIFYMNFSMNIWLDMQRISLFPDLTYARFVSEQMPFLQLPQRGSAIWREKCLHNDTSL